MDTDFVIDTAIAGPPPVGTPANRRQRIPLGFLGLGSQQTGRVILREWTDFNVHDPGATRSDRCDFSGMLVAERIPSWDPLDSSVPSPSVKEKLPILWVDADPSSRMTKAALVDWLPTAPSGQREEVVLTLELHTPQPASCLPRLDAAIEVVNTSTGQTQTSSQSPFLTKYRPQFYLRPAQF